MILDYKKRTPKESDPYYREDAIKLLGVLESSKKPMSGGYLSSQVYIKDEAKMNTLIKDIENNLNYTAYSGDPVRYKINVTPSVDSEGAKDWRKNSYSLEKVVSKAASLSKIMDALIMAPYLAA